MAPPLIPPACWPPIPPPLLPPLPLLAVAEPAPTAMCFITLGAVLAPAKLRVKRLGTTLDSFFSTAAKHTSDHPAGSCFFFLPHSRTYFEDRLLSDASFVLRFDLLVMVMFANSLQCADQVFVRGVRRFFTAWMLRV